MATQIVVTNEGPNEIAVSVTLKPLRGEEHVNETRVLKTGETQGFWIDKETYVKVREY